MKLSFKQYYEAKSMLLRENSDTIFCTSHEVYKYCKVPLLEDATKNYMAFKPRDILLVEWIRSNGVIYPTSITFNDRKFELCWNPTKMKSWVQQSTTQILEKH